MLVPDYPLETARLVLRPFRSGDIEDLYAIQSRPEVARFLYWDARDLAEVQKALDRKTGESVLENEGDSLALAVVWREVGKVVGEIHLAWRSQENRQGEIGFIFHPDYHGKGLATEAAEAAMRLGFADLGLHRIFGSCDSRNTASTRVMERLGMRLEAHFKEHQIFKGEWDEELVYALLDREWKARRD